LDTLIFVTAVVVTIFTTVEFGIYASAILALLFLLLRISRPGVDALGRLPLQNTKNDGPKYAYVPLDHPTFESVMNPPDGVLIFRFVGPLVYPNANYLDNHIVDYVRGHTKKCYVQALKKGDRPWNEPVHDKASEKAEKEKLPRLNAVIYDFSAVGMIDSTGIHTLVDIRKELNKYSNHNVEYHFTNLPNESVEEALIIAGFNTLGGSHNDEAVSVNSANGDDDTIVAKGTKDDEESAVTVDNNPRISKKFFHLTIDEAIAAATNTTL
jgi:sodium-independent sulfate anion transporter 11